MRRRSSRWSLLGKRTGSTRKQAPLLQCTSAHGFSVLREHFGRELREPGDLLVDLRDPEPLRVDQAASLGDGDRDVDRPLERAELQRCARMKDPYLSSAR